jgi:hypothetical protein
MEPQSEFLNQLDDLSHKIHLVSEAVVSVDDRAAEELKGQVGMRLLHLAHEAASEIATLSEVLTGRGQ